jgi:GNAT superfamily N-acetyltransferase
MESVTALPQLKEAFQRVKGKATNFTTNLFAQPEQVRTWIDRRCLFVRSSRGAILVFRRDRDFYHLYHVAADGHALGAALAGLRGLEPDGALAADLVGREPEVALLADVYASGGFRRYTSLVRMARIGGHGTRPDDYEDPGVLFACPDDAPTILAFLERLLDRFAEQVPELGDLEDAAAAGNILLAWHGQDLGGVLIQGTTGLTSVLRHWFVDDRRRGQGTGSRLIKTFFRLCRTSRRITLWVISDNENAIAKYRHYGFQAEPLIDQIMLRKVGG